MRQTVSSEIWPGKGCGREAARGDREERSDKELERTDKEDGIKGGEGELEMAE